MTDTNDNALSGEARLKSRRTRFLRFCALGMAASIVVGFVTGLASDLLVAGALPPVALYAIWAIALASFVWFSWAYFRRVDELDLMDNLWACLIGFYFYACAFPTWLLFNDLGLAPEVNGIVLYAATFIAMFGAYGLRKLGWR